MYIDYKKYIQSNEWREVRQRYFNSKMPQKCFGCNKPKQSGFHIHHKTYKRLGKEYLRDLCLVCPECHKAIHKLQKKTGMRLWGATNAFIRTNRKALGLKEDVYSKR